MERLRGGAGGELNAPLDLGPPSFVPVGGRRLAYRERGAGAPLLLVHAGMADGRMWAPQVASFEDRRRVVVPDLRGFGDSLADREPFSHAEDLAALLDALELTDASVVGASMGGAAAVDLALLRPDLVRELVLVGSALGGFPFEDEWLAEMEELAEHLWAAEDHESLARVELATWLAGPHRDLDDVDPRLVAALTPMLQRSYELHVDARERALDPPAAERLGELACPALVLVGALDLECVHACSRRLADGIAESELRTIEDAAHLPSLERPERFDALARDFLLAR